MQVGFTLEGTECSGSKPSSTISHNSKQPPANTSTKTIQKWTQTFPRKLRIPDEGFIDDLIEFILRYFEQIKKAAMGHPDAAWVREYETMFRLLRDGSSRLDLKLAAVPEVQGEFVSNLVGLLIVLGTGYNIYSHVSRNILKAETNRVVEQASQAAFVPLTRPARYLPQTISEFFDATKTEIKSRIDNLNELMTIISNELMTIIPDLVENFEETEPRHVDEIGPDHPQPPGVYHLIREIRQGQRPSRSTFTHPSGSLSTVHSAEGCRKPRSTLSKSSTKPSSRPANSPSNMSLVSENLGHSRLQALTKGTTSSTLSSEVKQSQSDFANSDSTRTSTSYQKGNTLWDDPAADDELLEPRVMDGQYYKIGEKMQVKIYHQSYKNFLRKPMLIDTGSDYSFIASSDVKELDLDTFRVNPKSLAAFANLSFEVDHAVVPQWQFSQGENIYQDFMFYIVPKIPGDSIVLGNNDRKKLGIQFHKVGGALIAVGDPEDPSTQEQRRLQQRRQKLDFIEFRNKKQQTLEAKRAESIEQKKAAAKPSEHTKAGSSISHRGS